MKRAPQLGTLFAVAACLIIAVPASTLAAPKIGGHENGFNLCEESALHLYAQGAKAGLDVGRNRIDDGKLLESGKVIPEPNPCQWRDQLDLMLHPPVVREPIAESSPAPIASTPTTTVAPTSAGGCPSSMAAESGSAGYSAVNPTSGAYGCYQVLPSTAAAHGCDLSTPAGQDACAATICATEGSGAWAASGASPC